MPISKIKGGAINDDAISTAKIVDDAVTSPKIVDSYTTALQTNPEFSGTEAARMPVGTTAQRANASAGDLRFNTTLSLMEYYDGTDWKAIDSPPTITSISPDNFDTAGDTITISGSNFQSGATVKIVASNSISASSVTVTNSSSISFDITSAMVADDNDPYDVVVTNPSGLSATIADALDFAPEPAFTVAAGTLYTIYDSGRGSISVTAGATSSESDATITYAVTTGALPSGLSISSSTGTITGSTSAVGSDTTVTFTITATATDGSGNTTTNTRQYSIIQKAQIITSYTSTGSGTFTVPTGTSAIDVLVVAGGGAGGRTSTHGYFNDAGGGAGAGGLIYRPSFPVTPGGSVSYSVGSGGTDSTPLNEATGSYNTGQDSTFGTLTAKGGGGGGHGSGGPSGQAPSYPGAGSWTAAGSPGGSGGGSANGDDGGAGPGAGIQSQQPGDSGTYGFGNAGGDKALFPTTSNQFGSGGGGAGAAGETFPSSPGNTEGNINACQGGIGKQYDISGSQVYYAGGGGAGQVNNGSQPQSGATGGQGGGGTGGGQGASHPANQGLAGTANRGGGGGGSGSAQNVISPRTDNSDQSRGGAGGSGVIIVKY